MRTGAGWRLPEHGLAAVGDGDNRVHWVATEAVERWLAHGPYPLAAHEDDGAWVVARPKQ